MKVFLGWKLQISSVNPFCLQILLEYIHGIYDLFGEKFMEEALYSLLFYVESRSIADWISFGEEA